MAMRACANAWGKDRLTVSSAAVEEDLGGLCGVEGDFDDVGISTAGTAAAQRAFSAHCVVARL